MFYIKKYSSRFTSNKNNVIRRDKYIGKVLFKLFIIYTYILGIYTRMCTRNVLLKIYFMHFYKTATCL